MKQAPAFKTIAVLLFIFAMAISQYALADDEDSDDDDKDDDDKKSNIIDSIISAPVVANGLVASEPTEINILLKRSQQDRETFMDASEYGFDIPEDGRMEVTLSGSFIRNPDMGNFLPARHVILTTGPQNPIKPNAEAVSGGQWHVVNDPTRLNVVTIVPNGDGLQGTRAKTIGFKVVHIRPNSNNRTHTDTPFYNGPVGSVGTVSIKIFDDDNDVVANGYKDIVFRANVGRQIYLFNGKTRDDDSNNSNTNFQYVEPGTVLDGTSIPAGGHFADGAPYAPQFLLFENFGSHDTSQFPTGIDIPVAGDASFIPFAGIASITVIPTANPRIAQLVVNGSQIGTAVLAGPTETSGGQILVNNTPTTAVGNGSTLFVPVQVGNKEGRYDLTVTLMDGNSVTNTIFVDD